MARWSISTAFCRYSPMTMLLRGLSTQGDVAMIAVVTETGQSTKLFLHLAGKSDKGDKVRGKLGVHFWGETRSAKLTRWVAMVLAMQWQVWGEKHHSPHRGRVFSFLCPLIALDSSVGRILCPLMALDSSVGKRLWPATRGGPINLGVVGSCSSFMA